MRANLSSFAGGPTGTAVGEIRLNVNAIAVAVGQTRLTGQLALSSRTDFTGFAGGPTSTTVGTIRLDIDALA